MNTLQEIKDAIHRLSEVERGRLFAWIREFDEVGDRVSEPTPAYGAAVDRHHLTVDEYLRLEEVSTIKHEYVAGEIFAMSGVSLRHNCITGNLFSAVAQHLRTGPCRAFFVDVKVQMKLGRDEFFYYPDVVVACQVREMEKHVIDNPKLIVEVLSPSAERADRWEKASNYRQIASLEEYVLVAQDRYEITIQRRCDNWKSQILGSSDLVAEFRSIELSLPLERIYQGAL